MSERIAEGWYADPQRPGEPGAERWWNGASWTAHTRNAPPAVPAPPAGPVGVRAPAPARTAAPTVRRTHDGEVLADVGPRIAAFVLDLIAVGIVCLPIGIMLETFSLATDTRVITTGTVMGVLWFGYQVLSVRHGGRTLGKRLLSLRVREAAVAPGDTSGQVSWRAAALRPVVTATALAGPGGLGMPLNIVDLVVLGNTQHRQALHDLIAQTYVVHDDGRSPRG